MTRLGVLLETLAILFWRNLIVNSSSPETIFLNGAFLTKFNVSLISTPIKAKRVSGFLGCAHECLKFPRCVSLNYEISAERNGQCELFDRILSQDEVDKGTLFRHKPGFVLVQTVATISKPKSCLEYFIAGVKSSGLYSIYDELGASYTAICDFKSEPGSAWTLVMSEYTPPIIPLFKTQPMYVNLPLDQDNPNYMAYRLSLSRMQALRSASTHWRITCSFPVAGVDYKDYVRARFVEFDLLKLKGSRVCKRVEYIDLRRHSCRECTTSWWQLDDTQLHHDSSVGECEFGKTPGFVVNEDDFGYYGSYNPNFRCVNGKQSSTNHWFGGYL